VEQHFPHERYRDDVGVIWYADVSAQSGRLAGLTLTPTRLRCELRCVRADVRVVGEGAGAIVV